MSNFTNWKWPSEKDLEEIINNGDDNEFSDDSIRVKKVTFHLKI